MENRRRKRRRLSQKHLQSIYKIFAVAAAAAGTLAVIALGISFCLNEYSIQLSIPAEQTVTLEYGESYDDSDVTAWFSGTIWEKSGFEIDVQKSGQPDTDIIGEYSVTYTASYKGQTATAIRNICVVDTQAPIILLTSDPNHFTNPNDEYIEEGFIATDNYDGDLTGQVIREEKDGTVTYSVEDSSHNRTTVTRQIAYRDEVAPSLVLNGESEMTVEAGEEFAEPGYRATDDCDGDITADVCVNGDVNTAVPGTYQLTYHVQDSSGNEAESTRTVRVEDTTAPEISLNGDARLYVLKGNEFNDPGATASDSCDGDLTDAVKTDNPVNIQKAGVYTVKYTVADRAGNQADAVRTVYVYEEKQEEEEQTEKETDPSGGNSNSENPGKGDQDRPEDTEKETSAEKEEPEEAETNDSGEKIIYLTFDDGPGKYTEKLLDILDKYDVKVTFFVTNQYPKYQYLIAEEYERGHTVAIHSYSHDYSTIYASESAFYEDINQMNQIIFDQTGTYASILRFPGGSSNTVSKKYCEGIMTALTESMETMGFRYADWNVTSGDAGETKSTSKIISNVISGIKKHSVSVVLQHDIHEFSVDAVEDIIVWALDNGYTFRAMDDTTEMVHHRVGN
ncbi:MAG: polysaccharide deacetylase family protein [Lachnospiraceae bacterium]|nr:polysaccharide deacetylase family protein [Lachnospiraceae bacterium]